MLKKMSTALGLGLTLLWMLGLGDPAASSWLTWVMGIAAVCSFGIVAFTPAYPSNKVRILTPLAIAAGLAFFGVIAVSIGVVAWQKWWTIAFACFYFVLTLMSASERRQPPMPETAVSPERDEQENYKKSA